MSADRKGLFIGDDGRNLMITFMLDSSLFLLWGFCNGMIDVMDKHFQDELSLSKAQSAWVQFAHYLGYFLMSMPAAWLAARLGYKGGIIAGLMIVAGGGGWVFPCPPITTRGHAGRGGRILVHPCHPYQRDGTRRQRIADHRVHGVSGRGLFDRDGAGVSRNHRQSLYDGAGRPAIRGHAHQPGAILQRHWLDLRSARRQHLFLLQGRAGP